MRILWVFGWYVCCFLCLFSCACLLFSLFYFFSRLVFFFLRSNIIAILLLLRLFVFISRISFASRFNTFWLVIIDWPNKKVRVTELNRQNERNRITNVCVYRTIKRPHFSYGHCVFSLFLSLNICNQLKRATSFDVKRNKRESQRHRNIREHSNKRIYTFVCKNYFFPLSSSSSLSSSPSLFQPTQWTLMFGDRHMYDMSYFNYTELAFLWNSLSVAAVFFSFYHIFTQMDCIYVYD